MTEPATIAALRAALEAGPTPGPWVCFHKHKYNEWHVSVPIEGSSMRLGLFPDGIPTERPQEDAQVIVAALNAAPELLAELDRLRADFAALREEHAQWATAARLVIEATPDQLAIALEALEDVLRDNVLVRRGQGPATAGEDN